MNCNLRVSSGTGDTPESANGFGLNFNNNTSLTTTNELQFVKGVYCTKTYAPTGFTTASVYQNYVNYFTPQNGFRPTYTSIGSGGKRYVSFLFSNINPNNTYNKIDTIILRFVYINDGVASTVGNLYDTSSTTFQVRLNNNSPSISTDSTAWLNANSIGAPTLNTKNTNGTSCLTRTFESSTDGTNTYYNCFIQIPPGCGYCNMNLYTRVGFDMSAGIALRRIELSSNTVINIPSQFNANLYINSNGTRFDINLLPNLPIATYCNLSASFIYNSLTFNATPSQAITSGSNYTFTNFSFLPNACNLFATGSFVVRNNLGSNFYTSNTIQSIDYYVARPNSAIISFSPGVWSSNSNYFVGTIQTPSGGSGYPSVGAGAIVYYTVSNDNNSFSFSSNTNVGTGRSFSFSNLLTNSNQYLNRAFFMTTHVEGTMRDLSTRLSSNLIAGSNGILSPPTGHSNTTGVSFNSVTGLTLLTSSNFYNRQIFTLQLCNASYGFQSFSNAGFPRSIYGFFNDPNSTVPFVSPNVSNAPITFPFVASNNFSVYDTFYNAYLYLVFSNGASTCNTSNFISTAKTGLPTDTRSNWSGASIVYNGTTFPNQGQVAGASGNPAITVYRSGSSFVLNNSTNIAVNSTTNPGRLDGCNYTLSIQNSPDSYTYTFSNSDYSGTTNTINSGITLTSQDYSSGRAAGFYLSFNLSYNYFVSGGNQNPFNPSITFNSIQKSTNVYIGDDPGQITISVGETTYSSNVLSNRPVIVTDLKTRLITFTNLTQNSIIPRNFGSITFSYNTCNNPTRITATQAQGNTIITGANVTTNFSINNPLGNGIGLNINGCNSIVNYTMSNNFNNLATSSNISVSDSVFNDSTNIPAGLTLYNGDLKWILGAWRADYSDLNFNSNALRGTFGNSRFELGSGIVQYVVSFAGEATKQFRISASSTTNITNVIANFPQDPNPDNSGFGYGTFDCRVPVLGIDSATYTGGCAVGRPNNNVFTIYTPTGYALTNFNLWITVETGSISNVIINY
jgi:hypothetical protein